ncbi:hypothetical protein RCC89_11500 [Cytophagaceae bacterium ABcell3]|nr:hypothetical protein RCC89_11500 [Cytophagaceae bacterium ABcell3]
MKSKYFILLLIFACISSVVHGSPDPYPKRKYREHDILYRKHIVRSINLSKFDNNEIFGNSNALVEILLDAVKNGKLQPYETPHLEKALSVDEFWERLKIQEESDYSDYSGYWAESDIEKSAWEEVLPEAPSGETIEDQYYLPSQLFRIEYGEDLLVDKIVSDVVYDPKYITLFIPASISPKGIHEPVASFSFYDCAKVFRADKRAVAENPLMNGRNINFTEVFLLRLYNSYIVKLGRIDDPYFDQMYSKPMDAFMASKKAEHKVISYLYKLFNPE